MDPEEEVCDRSTHHSKKTHITLKKGRMLTPSLGGVTTTFQKTDSAFSTQMSLATHQGTLLQCIQIDVQI